MRGKVRGRGVHSVLYISKVSPMGQDRVVDGWEYCNIVVTRCFYGILDFVLHTQSLNE